MHKTKPGIVGYGSYIPKYRIKSTTIAQANNQDVNKIKNGLLIEEKSIPGKDEDTATISVQASQNALLRANINPSKIGAIYVGSESHPYAVKPTATILGQAVNSKNNYSAADLEFACKAGTATLQICYGLVKSEMVEYGLAVGADTSQAAPEDILEYSASAGGAAFIIGNNIKEIVATIDDTLSFTTDTPDFWRRPTQHYPIHAGRFTGEPAYFRHVITATQNILDKTKLKPTDFDYVIFHQPNGKFPLAAAKKLGFSKEQIFPGLLVSKIGNTYSASSPISLTAVLDIAQPNQKILLTSYGSGSGSDSFIFTTTNILKEKQNLAPTTQSYIDKKTYLSYSQYLKHMELIS
jgi:hydroxymethylglutaryl-CoA synthase